MPPAYGASGSPGEPGGASFLIRRAHDRGRDSRDWVKALLGGNFASERAMDYQLLWSRYEKAAQRSKQLVVGTGRKSDGADGADRAIENLVTTPPRDRVLTP